MPEFPKIDFSAPVQDVSRETLRLGEAQRGAFKTMEEGLTLYSKELIRTQQQKAAVELADHLNTIENEISTRKFVSTQEVKDFLGADYDKLDPSLKSQLTYRGLDINSGEPREFDRGDIPMWMVAGSIFDSRARKAVNVASENLSLGGWKADFQGKAEEELVKRKMKINEHQIKSLNDYLVEQQTQGIVELANAGAFDKARSDLSDSKVFDPAYKERVSRFIDKVEQTKPVYDALQRDDYAEMASIVGQLNDPKKFTALDPKERAAFSDRLKSEIRQFQDHVRKEKDRLMEQNAAEFVDPATGRKSGWNPIFEKVRAGVVPSYKDVPPPGVIKPDEQKQMIAYVDGKIEGKEPKTNLFLYSYLSDLARTNPEKFVEYPLTMKINELSPEDFKHFQNLKAERASGPNYDNFVSTEEAINVRLAGRGVDLKSKDSGVQEGIGSVKSLIQHELAALGRRPTLEERDKVIDKVISEKVPLEGWIWKTATFKNANIPARYEAAIKQVYSNLARLSPKIDQNISAENLKKTWEDFSKYEKPIVDGWPFLGGGKKLRPEDAVLIYGTLKAAGNEIDSELRRSGRPLTDENRAALATQMYLSRRAGSPGGLQGTMRRDSSTFIRRR